MRTRFGNTISASTPALLIIVLLCCINVAAHAIGGMHIDFISSRLVTITVGDTIIQASIKIYDINYIWDLSSPMKTCIEAKCVRGCDESIVIASLEIIDNKGRIVSVDEFFVGVLVGEGRVVRRDYDIMPKAQLIMDTGINYIKILPRIRVIADHNISAERAAAPFILSLIRPSSTPTAVGVSRVAYLNGSYVTIHITTIYPWDARLGSWINVVMEPNLFNLRTDVMAVITVNGVQVQSEYLGTLTSSIKLVKTIGLPQDILKVMAQENVSANVSVEIAFLDLGVGLKIDLVAGIKSISRVVEVSVSGIPSTAIATIPFTINVTVINTVGLPIRIESIEVYVNGSSIISNTIGKILGGEASESSTSFNVSIPREGIATLSIVLKYTPLYDGVARTVNVTKKVEVLPLIHISAPASVVEPNKTLTILLSIAYRVPRIKIMIYDHNRTGVLREETILAPREGIGEVLIEAPGKPGKYYVVAVAETGYVSNYVEFLVLKPGEAPTVSRPSGDGVQTIQGKYDIIIRPASVNAAAGKKFNFTVSINPKPSRKVVLKVYRFEESIGGWVLLPVEVNVRDGEYIVSCRAPSKPGSYKLKIEAYMDGSLITGPKQITLTVSTGSKGWETRPPHTLMPVPATLLRTEIFIPLIATVIAASFIVLRRYRRKG